MELPKEPDTFDTLDAKDGFHVVMVEACGSISVYCQAYASGEQINLCINSSDPEDASIEIETWPNATPENKGEALRLQLVLDSVARYLNTGGSWSSLMDYIKTMRIVACGNLIFPGYYLQESYATNEGGFQHVFVKDDNSGKAVLWEEPSYSAAGGVFGGFIDHTTVQALREQEEMNDDEEETKSNPFMASEEIYPDYLQLPYKSKPETEEST